MHFKYLFQYYPIKIKGCKLELSRENASNLIKNPNLLYYKYLITFLRPTKDNLRI